MDGTKENVFHNWVQGNIYSHKKLDGILYLIFYIIIPVTITAWSLYAFPSDFAAAMLMPVDEIYEYLEDSDYKSLSPQKKSCCNTFFMQKI